LQGYLINEILNRTITMEDRLISGIIFIIIACISGGLGYYLEKKQG